MHSDLHGPTAVQAIGGPKYFAVTIDDKSRKLFVHLLKGKDDYPTQDGGGEYASNAFEAWMRAEGIEHQKTEAHSSSSNGVAERAIRTLNDSQRAMREDALERYAEAFSQWSYPKRGLYGQSTRCLASPNVWLGFAPNRKAHVLVEQSNGRILTSRDVVFDEGAGTRQRVVIEDFDGEGMPEQVGDESIEPEPKPRPPEAHPEPPVADPPPLRRSKRSTRAPVRGDDARFDVSSYNRSNRVQKVSSENGDDCCDGDASQVVQRGHGSSRRQSVARCDGVRDEIDCRSRGLEARQSPEGEERCGLSMGLRLQTRRGWRDREIQGSSVAASDSYRVLLSIVACEDLELLQLDIKTAFLHGTLDEEIYMEQPEGFAEDGDFVWQLVKALYGLKQAARAFYLRLREVLEGLGFTRSETDHAVFSRRSRRSLVSHSTSSTLGRRGCS